MNESYEIPEVMKGFVKQLQNKCMKGEVSELTFLIYMQVLKGDSGNEKYEC